MDPGVRLVLEQVAQRVPDGGILEQVGGDLVEERLKGVVVVAIDEDHVGVCPGELPGGSEPAETPSEHDHPRPFPAALCALT